MPITGADAVDRLEFGIQVAEPADVAPVEHRRIGVLRGLFIPGP